MKMHKIRLSLCILGIVSITQFCTTSCVQQEDLVSESNKTLEGNWHIAKVVQNSTDLTPLFDFTDFKIQFFKDPAGVQTYQIQNPIPFVVKTNGTWKLDDPIYPHAFTLQEDNATINKTIHFTFPILDGKRVLRFNYSPGCASVNYQFTLEQDSIE